MDPSKLRLKARQTLNSIGRNCMLLFVFPLSDEANITQTQTYITVSFFGTGDFPQLTQTTTRITTFEITLPVSTSKYV